jgi:serine/threonine protein kinase
VTFVEISRKALVTINRRREGCPGSQSPSTTVILGQETKAFCEICFGHDELSLGQEIGHGQTGAVRLGIDKSGERVAVKIMRKSALTSSELESFRRELYAFAVLRHLTLVRLRGYTDVSPFYIVTEYLEHGSLFDALRVSLCNRFRRRKGIEVFA